MRAATKYQRLNFSDLSIARCLQGGCARGDAWRKTCIAYGRASAHQRGARSINGARSLARMSATMIMAA